MSLQSTDEVILRAAWKLLWTPGTNYYLPNVMKNGLNWNNVHIPPLEGSSVQDVGPVSLFKDSILGYISLKMNENKINGLPSITNQGFAFDDPTHTLTLSIGFGDLLFSGRYEVDSGGIAGCAIGAANGLLGSSKAMRLAAVSGDNIDLAYQYRDKLTASDNPNGNILVDAYYEQNDTLNSIVLAQNHTVNGQNNPCNGMFQTAWVHYSNDGKDTAYFMNNTSQAASNPDDTGTGFNDDDYNQHGFYMETVLAIEAKSLQDLGDPRGDALHKAMYDNAGNPSLTDEARAYNGSSVNSLMGFVKTGGSQSATVQASELAIDRKTAIYEQAQEKARAFHQDWLANNRHEEFAPGTARFASTGDISQIKGSFSDSFVLPVLSVTGVISTQGDSLVVNVTDLKAELPSLHVTLTPDHASDLNKRVQNDIANAGFMQNLMKTKIVNGLNDASVRTYLSDRINDAIKKIFG